MEPFISPEADPEVQWDQNVVRLSALIPMLHREFTSRRVPPFEADDLVGILLERIWEERLARARAGAPGGLRLTAGDIKRLAWAMLEARRRTAACDGVADALLRGDRVLSSIGDDGVDPDWFPDPRHQAAELVEAEDMKAALYRAAKRAAEPGLEEGPAVVHQVREILRNAPYPPRKRLKWDRTTKRARALLRKVAGPLLGLPAQKKLAKRHEEEK